MKKCRRRRLFATEITEDGNGANIVTAAANGKDTEDGNGESIVTAAANGKSTENGNGNGQRQRQRVFPSARRNGINSV